MASRLSGVSFGRWSGKKNDKDIPNWKTIEEIIYLDGVFLSTTHLEVRGSASLIERERQSKREKLLQTRAWFIKSSSLLIRTSSLCMRSSEHVKRRMSRSSDGGRGMEVLNSAGNQLVKLNIKHPKNDYVRQSDFSAISISLLNLCPGTHKQSRS